MTLLLRTAQSLALTAWGGSAAMTVLFALHRMPGAAGACGSITFGAAIVAAVIDRQIKEATRA